MDRGLRNSFIGVLPSHNHAAWLLRVPVKAVPFVYKGTALTG
ncbi:hypothetical protein MJA45_26690 [Paenibacillus aurantius]|uniref:Uncharacterized protein n=1 Tax=Paenibacillus aurantius TaxID=2918900 RepID=A0AA96LD53_9BACL|nr:hypothetical protein [Paenibacillus aurantius]WNQ11145.1 hypothetical protein MJA45_26690 [Paenibacillus aurantius]